MRLALIPRAHTTALAILPILGMVLYVKVSLYKYLIRGSINPCHLIRLEITVTLDSMQTLATFNLFWGLRGGVAKEFVFLLTSQK